MIGELEVLGDAMGEVQPFVIRGSLGDLDHGRGRVDTGQFVRLRVASCEATKQVAGSATDVEHTPRSGDDGEGESSSAIGYPVVKVTQPTLFVAGGPLIELLDVPVGWHGDDYGPVTFPLPANLGDHADESVGARWVDALPAVTKALKARWDLQLGGPFQPGRADSMDWTATRLGP